MLILQHAWSRWTKASRGAGAKRPTLAPPYPLLLPPDAPASGVWRHEIRALEDEDFISRERSEAVTPDDWRREEPHHPANLAWRQTAEGIDLTLTRPWPSMLTTAWPAHLPPIPLSHGRIIRIDWNGRFHASSGGSNRAYFYEQHSYLLTLSDAPTADLFLAREPDKIVDLTTRIY